MSQGNSYRTDDEILEGLRSKAAGSFEAFFDRYADLVYGFGLKMTGADPSARRILKESFVSALASIDTVKSGRSMERCLLREAVRSFLSLRERTGGADGEIPLEEVLPRMESGRSAAVHDWSLDPDEEARRNEEKEALRRFVADMPAAYALVLVLHDMEEMTVQEVADIVQRPLPAVKTDLQLARLYLRRELSRKFGPPEEPGPGGAR